MIVLKELQETWAEMFNSIDSFVTKAKNVNPSLAKELDRKIILKAMAATQKLDQLLVEAKKISDAKQVDKDQETLFSD